MERKKSPNRNCESRAAPPLLFWRSIVTWVMMGVIGRSGGAESRINDQPSVPNLLSRFWGALQALQPEGVAETAGNAETPIASCVFGRRVERRRRRRDMVRDLHDGHRASTSHFPPPWWIVRLQGRAEAS